MRFLVLSSSRGTTFQAILNAIAEGSLTAQCLGLVSDRKDRGCIEKARKAGLPTVIVEKRRGEEREAYDRRVHEEILQLVKLQTPNPPTLLACIGWMRIFSPWFIETWRDRIINVHPALLPKYGGEGMYGMKVHEAVLASKEKETGMTIHLMDEGVDTGKILLQKRCPVLPEDTPEILRARVQELEKEWYPRVLQMVHTGELRLPE